MRTQNENAPKGYGCSRQQVARGKILLGLARATQRTSAVIPSPCLSLSDWHSSSVACRKHSTSVHGRNAAPYVSSRGRYPAAARAALDTFSQSSSPESSRSTVLSYLPSLETGPVEPGLTVAPRQLPRSVEGPADNPQLANPLERQNRLGTGWMGVILEYEGVAVDDCADLHTRSWQQLAVDEGRAAVPHWALRRAEGMKNEQVVQEVLLWSRQPMEVRRLCARKEEIFRELRGSCVPALPPGTSQLLDILAKNDVPVALACSAPEARVRPALEAIGLLPRLAAIITAEDVARGRPDPDGVLYAAQQLQRPPIRCVLIGNSNASVEAARECGMAVVAVAGRTPVYELTAADLVVRSLSELSFVNLKQLFGRESHVAFESEMELEPVDTPTARTQTLLLD